MQPIAHPPLHPSSDLVGSAADPRAGEQNFLLRALPADEYTRLLDHLEPVELAPKQVLWRSGTPIRSVYFPRTAVASLLTPLEGEQAVEAASVGREGMAGTAIVLGAQSSSIQALVQIAGTAARMEAARLREYLRASDGGLAVLLLRHAQLLYEQTAQAVACNRRHGINERCARWLLMTHDRVGEDQFPLTHEFLALMLGVRRASVTVSAGTLQHAGLIRYTRGRVTVLDRVRLETASCHCYAIVRARHQELLGDQPTAA